MRPAASSTSRWPRATARVLSDQRVVRAEGRVAINARVYSFKLGGRRPKPVIEFTAHPDTAPAGARHDARRVSARGHLYDTFCLTCHGIAAITGGVLPDLRKSGRLQDAALWKDAVVDAALASRGMPRFARPRVACGRGTDPRLCRATGGHPVRRRTGGRSSKPQPCAEPDGTEIRDLELANSSPGSGSSDYRGVQQCSRSTVEGGRTNSASSSLDLHAFALAHRLMPPIPV